MIFFMLKKVDTALKKAPMTHLFAYKTFQPYLNIFVVLCIFLRFLFFGSGFSYFFFSYSFFWLRIFIFLFFINFLLFRIFQVCFSKYDNYNINGHISLTTINCKKLNLLEKNIDNKLNFVHEF